MGGRTCQGFGLTPRSPSCIRAAAEAYSTGIVGRSLTADKPYDRLKAKVTGVLGGLRVPFNGVPSDACASLQQGACPVQPGQEYVYRADIPVSRAYPTVSTIHTRLQGLPDREYNTYPPPRPTRP